MKLRDNKGLLAFELVKNPLILQRLEDAGICVH